MIGCAADKFFPDFYDEFKKEYSDLAIDSEDIFDIYYKSGIGKIGRIFAFALKDRTTNVVNMLKFLMKVKTPYDVIEENPKNYSMHKRYKELYPKYQKFLKKAKDLGKVSDKLLFFTYGGDLSMGSELSTELRYLFPGKVIVVAYLSGIKANISIRGNKIRTPLLKAIKDLKDATGGGHENACGATVRREDLDKFKANLEAVI